MVGRETLKIAAISAMGYVPACSGRPTGAPGSANLPARHPVPVGPGPHPEFNAALYTLDWTGPWQGSRALTGSSVRLTSHSLTR